MGEEENNVNEVTVKVKVKIPLWEIIKLKLLGKDLKEEHIDIEDKEAKEKQEQ